MPPFLLRLPAVLAAFIPATAFAHVGAGDTHGFVAGFGHPVGGIDHVLAMVTVGLLAWQLRGRALWLVPGAFVAMMAAGGTLGTAGMSLPYVETCIALSVVILGAIVAFDIRAPVAIAMGLVGTFAIFHGYAHGAEMPGDASGVAYGLGFASATALLHLSGIGLGFGLGRINPVIGRATGGLVALAGVGLLSGVV